MVDDDLTNTIDEETSEEAGRHENTKEGRINDLPRVDEKQFVIHGQDSVKGLEKLYSFKNPLKLFLSVLLLKKIFTERFESTE